MTDLICGNTPHCHTNSTKTPFIQTAVKWNHHIHTQSVAASGRWSGSTRASTGLCEPPAIALTLYNTYDRMLDVASTQQGQTEPSYSSTVTFFRWPPLHRRKDEFVLQFLQKRPTVPSLLLNLGGLTWSFTSSENWCRAVTSQGLCELFITQVTSVLWAVCV